MIYEATIRVHAPNGLNDEHLREWGDLMDTCLEEVGSLLEIVHEVPDFKAEAHGPDAVLSAA